MNTRDVRYCEAVARAFLLAPEKSEERSLLARAMGEACERLGLDEAALEQDVEGELQGEGLLP